MGEIMDLVMVIIRTVLFYFIVLIVFRLMGKREIGELSVQDLVVSILIAELVAISIENYKDSILLTVVALIINRGIINHKEMIKQRYSLDDLLLELRNNNIKNLKDVEYAVLENSGKLNIFKYSFLGIDSANPFPLILDGIIQKDTLDYIEKDEKWIMNYLNDNNLKKEDIFYAFYKNKQIYIIKRNELKD